MYKYGKRALALLLTAALSAGTLVGLPLTAAAQEPAPEDAYVLRYEGEGAKPYLYGSRYEFKHSYNDPAAGESSVWTFWNCPEIFHLVNTRDGNGIAAYCTDADTGTRSNTGYRRINLEDSSYHADGAAQRLRTVLLNTFPRKSVDAVQAAANSAGFPVTQLAQGELISATQQAIWKLTHGDKYTVDDHSTGLRSMGAYDANAFVYPDSLEAKLTDHTASNMENLYNYFLSLPGTAATADAVSEYTFEDVYYTAEQAGDGFTVTVTFAVNTTVNEGDRLTLRATCGNQVQEYDLQSGSGSVTFTGLPAQTPVKLEITGLQQGGDVYLFDALGDRGVSQSMIGYDDSLLPVYGSVTAGPDRVLQLHKTTGDESNTPLKNIRFSVYEVGSLADYLAGKLAIGAMPTEDDLTLYATADRLIGTVTTGADGMARLNLGQTDRIYLVVEAPSSAVEAPVDPFFVCVPMRDADADTWTYTVKVSPKNTPITEEVILNKDVTAIDNDHDTFAVGEEHSWIIRASLPAGLATATKFAITDTLDHRLTFRGGVLVSVGEQDAPAKSETVVLENITDYALTLGTAQDANGNDVDAFTLALTPAGMEKAAAAQVSGTPELRIYFAAIIDSDAHLGTEIPNRAHVEYVNELGLVYTDDSDLPEVHTGGLNLRKVSAKDGTPLAGASFKLARPAAPGESPDLTRKIGGKNIDLVYVSFYPTTDLSGEPVFEVTTGENGLAVLYGLAYGDYYLIETAAPEGFNKLETPVAAKVNATSHVLNGTDGSFVTVSNSAKFALPNAGGMGTTLFTVGGASLILLGAAVLVLMQKKHSA